MPFLRNQQSLVASFACFNLAAKFSAVNLLTSGVVIFLSEFGIFFQFHRLLRYRQLFN